MSADDDLTPRAEPWLLELRIHGVNNTPVTEILGVGQSSVEQCDGDVLGGFWTPTDEALSTARAAAERRWSGRDEAGHPAPGPDEWVPPDYVGRHVRREAYSWGAQARYSGAVPGGAGSLGLRITRAGWLLLAPLGIVNAAYWSRQLIPDLPDGAPPGEETTAAPTRSFGRGLSPIRVFGLGMTLLFVAALQAVALDLLATQCLGSVTCPSVPSWLAGLSSLPWGRRMAVLSVVPVAGLVLLQWLSAGARVRYEVPTRPSTSTSGPRAGRRIPILSQRDLWQRWRLAERTSSAHLSAGLTLVALTLAWSELWGPDRSCRTAADLIDGTCRDAVLNRPWYALLVVLAVAGLVGATVLVARQKPAPVEVEGLAATAPESMAPRDDLDAAATWWVIGSAALLAVVDATMWIEGSDPVDPSVPGLSLVPGALMGLLLLIALTGLTWRRRPGHTRVAVGACVVVAVGVVWGALPSTAPEPEPWPLLVSLAGFAGLLGVTVAGLRSGAGDRPPLLGEAWRGSAPGVFLLLALGLQMTLGSTLVVAVGDWFNGTSAAGCLVPMVGARSAGCPDVGLTMPPAYEVFVAGVAGGLVLTVLFALITPTVRLFRHLDFGSRPLTPEEPPGLDAVRQRAGTFRSLVADQTVREAVLSTRSRADLLQRAESVLGSVAVGLALTLAWTLLDTPGRGWLVANTAGLTRQLTVVGLWLIVAGWAYGFVRVLTSKGAEPRPAGLMWDLLCFLPRTAHPFGPPCYAERAVPEIAARVDAWLTGADLPAGSPQVARRRVVLAPHSMGAVLAVSALMMPQGSETRADRVALLTYGTQVRPYFGRFFPELFGPGPTGMPAVRCAGLGTCVWDEVREVPADEGAYVVGPRLVEILAPSTTPAPAGTMPGPATPAATTPAPRWLSLWRPTDPLGMQVGVPGVDRRAEEVDASGYLPQVATHGGYARTVAYRAAFDDLVRRFGSEPPA